MIGRDSTARPQENVANRKGLLSREHLLPAQEWILRQAANELAEMELEYRTGSDSVAQEWTKARLAVADVVAQLVIPADHRNAEAVARQGLNPGSAADVRAIVRLRVRSGGQADDESIAREESSDFAAAAAVERTPEALVVGLEVSAGLSGCSRLIVLLLAR